jgi:hypothetical protein
VRATFASDTEHTRPKMGRKVHSQSATCQCAWFPNSKSMRFAHSYLPRAKNSPISEYSRIARDAVLPVAPVGGEDVLFFDANTGPLGLIRTISGDETYGRTEGH